MRDLLLTCPLDTKRDKALWKFNEKGVFTAKNMYNKLINVYVNKSFKYMWKAESRYSTTSCGCNPLLHAALPCIKKM
jgi:hypothetical protein